MPRINYQKPIKKPLNIHNLSSREKKDKEKDFNSQKDSISIIKDLSNNKNYFINSQLISKSLNKKLQITNNAIVLPDIRHFKFRITNKKKIRYMYLNQNRIIENSNSCANNQNNRSRILDKFIFKNPFVNKKYENVPGEALQQIEVYKNKNKNNNSNKGKMLKSQSDIFPLINKIY